MRGKYSPTVTGAYQRDQNWFENYCGRNNPNPAEWSLCDPEGFDSYGYNEQGYDRAGNHENEYACNDGLYDCENYNEAYEDAYDGWGFDGVKPVKNG